MFSKEDIKKAVHDGLKEIMNKYEITIKDNETFQDYGVDSLDRMNLLLEVEKRLSVELSEIDLEEVNTINLLEVVINDKYK